MTRPSQHRTTATALTPTTVGVANIGDLIVGDPICIYDAVSSTPPTGAPPTPAAILSGAGEARTYRFRYVTSDRCFGYVSPAMTANADVDGNIVLEWALGTLDPAAEWVIVYRQIRAGAEEPIAAAVCTPRGAGILAGLRISVVDDGGSTYVERGLPDWFASADDPVTLLGRLHTRISAISGTELTVAGPVNLSLAGGVLAHDAGQDIAASLAAGDDVTLAPGFYQCHGTIDLDGHQQSIIGAKPRRGELTNLKATELNFEDGDGLVVRGVAASLEKLTIGQRASRTLPPLNLILPQRPASGTDYWTHGAAVLFESRSYVRSVSVMRARGTGVAIIAKAGGIGGNANLCAWSDVESSQHTGHGMFVDGSDANASHFASINVVGNSGWGVLDESLLGSAYTAPHASANALGPYRIDSSANKSVITYPYTESGQGDSILGPYVTTVGGPQGVVQGAGPHLSGKGFGYISAGNEGIYKTSFSSHLPAYQSLLRRYDSSDLRHHRRATARNVQDYVGTTGYPSRNWHSQHERGYGLMEFPRGVLVGGILLRGIDTSSPPRGTYDTVDVCFTTAGTIVRPTVRFGVGPSWQKYVYRVGDTIVPGDGHAYVCTSTVGEFGSASGTTEPKWAATVVDGDVTWTRWGSDVPSFA